MLCITVAFSAVCFFPLDVANAGGSLDCGDANDNCGGISFTWIWYILFVIIVFLLCVVLPFNVFFYETVDIDPPPMEKRCQSACSYTVGGIVVVAALSFIYCFIIRNATIGVDTYEISNSNTFAIEDAVQPLFADDKTIAMINATLTEAETNAGINLSSIQDTLQIEVSVLVRLISFFCIIGWLFFSIFAGIGIIGLPYKLI